MPLNDANTVFAESYWLLNSRIGYKHDFNRFSFNIYAGGDNLLDEIYSLGNDTNAVGNRYFNPSPARNWQFGGSFRIFL